MPRRSRAIGVTRETGFERCTKDELLKMVNKELGTIIPTLKYIHKCTMIQLLKALLKLNKHKPTWPW